MIKSEKIIKTTYTPEQKFDITVPTLGRISYEKNLKPVKVRETIVTSENGRKSHRREHRRKLPGRK